MAAGRVVLGVLRDCVGIFCVGSLRDCCSR